MILTRRELHKIMRDWRIGLVPEELEKELLDIYGHEFETEEGLIIEYSEQDIVEELRRVFPPYSLLVHPGDPPFLKTSQNKGDGNDL